MTDNLLKQTFRQRYNRINTPILNQITPQDEYKTAIGEDADGEVVVLKQGDIIANVSSVQNRKKAFFSIVLSTHESTGVTVYDLDEEVYGYYPSEDLIKDLANTNTEILKDILPLTQKPNEEASENLDTLLRNYDPGEVPHMPELPHGADTPLQVTDEIEVTAGDVLYNGGEFEFILNTRGEFDEPQSDQCIIKYNLNDGYFGFYPVELLREDMSSSVWPEMEILTDPWDLRS